jgi:putative ABC transport system permease protein
MIQDFFNLAVKGIKDKGVRSYLTMIGIFIGIAAVVSLISLGQGMQQAINKQFELLGTDVIIILPGSGFETFGTATSKLTQHDLDLIRKIQGVELAGGIAFKSAKVKFKGETKYTWIAGIPKDETQDVLLEGTGVTITEGQERFKQSDKYKVAIGYLIGKGDFFKKKVDLGDEIEINDQKFEVIGKVSQIGNRQDDFTLWIPLETAKELFGIKDEFYEIIARSKAGHDVSKVANRIKEKLRKDRGLKEGEEDFSVQTMEQIRESVSMILDAVRYVLIGIAAISLLVGGVGIMNIMYSSVLERTQEIGVMKAIGARNSDILILFLIESGILGMVGGAIGCSLGIGMSKAIEIFSAEELGSKILQASISLELILGALAFSFIVGCLSGILPARQASQLRPVDALRYE